MITNYSCGQFATLQGHQHSATRERIDERGRISNRQESSGRSNSVAPETFQRNREPGCVCPRLLERMCCPAVLADDFAHYALCVRSTFPYVPRRGDKAKIAEATFDTA